MSSAVLDASALLALCFAEKGARKAIAQGKDGLISAVNYSEAIAKSTYRGVPVDTVRHFLATLKLTIIPFDEAHAIEAAYLRPATRGLNVSFADRACLVTAALAKLPALTADSKWEKIKCPVRIIQIR